MPDTCEHFPLRLRLFTAMSALIVLSIALPIGILWWSLGTFLADRPTGRATREQPVYSLGSLRNGELWYPVFQFTNDAWIPPYDFRIVRLNLETGVQRETGIKAADGRCCTLWAGDELYLLNRTSDTQTELYKVVGTSLEKVQAPLSNFKSLTVQPFLYQGQLTTVVQSSVLIDINGNIHDDEFQLVHLVDGKWVKGRKILLPGICRVWYDDPQRECVRLRPRTSQTPSRWAGVDLNLTVISCRDTVHLFYSDNLDSPQKPSFTAYRSGFEFSDELDVASALAPENANREVSGWLPIQPSAKGDWWVQMACSRQGIVFEMNPNEIDRPYRFVRLSPAGRWEELTGTETLCTARPLNVSLVADPSNDDTYVVRQETNWNDVTVCRIDRTTILAPHLSLPGSGEQDYRHRLCWLWAGLILAWMVHCAVLIGGTDWLTNSPSVTIYKFGHEQATIASATRRALSLAIDVSLLLMILVTTISLQTRWFGLHWDVWSIREMCDACVEFEWDHFNRMAEHRFNPFQPSFHPGALLMFVRQLATIVGMSLLGHPDELTWRVSLIGGIVLCCLKSVFEGLTGTTPGKWLLGLRTVQSTLRPSNVARLLLRDILYVAEVLFLLTPLVAVVSMVLSKHRQRLGDRVADTLVIRRHT